jgi:hypothetical protein
VRVVAIRPFVAKMSLATTRTRGRVRTQGCSLVFEDR